jgi:hypothetical protein
MEGRVMPNQVDAQALNLGRLTRSMSHNFHKDYVKMLIDFKSKASSNDQFSSDDYMRKKDLINWVKEKTALLNEFRCLLRIPYDINTYTLINTVNEKMFRRRMQVNSIFEQLREFAIGLTGLKMPIYAIEEALYFIKDGRKRIDWYKLEYLLKDKKQSDGFEELEKLAKDDIYQTDDEIEITYKGFFENIDFCVDRYFQTHHYLRERAICQIGDLAEIELFYHKKEAIKFSVFRIKLLKTFDIFAISDDVKSGMNRLKFELNKLAMKINSKIRDEFFVSVNEVMDEDFPEEIRDFEAYEEHENEHKQLGKILKYLKKFLKTLIIQVVNDKFALKDRNYGKYLEFNVPVFKRRSRHGFMKGKMPFNKLKFVCRPIEDNPRVNSVLTTVGLKISTLYHDESIREDRPFSFIDSISESLESDFMRIDLDSDGYNEIIEDSISWADHFTVNMEVNACHPVDIIDNILNKAQQTSLYMYMIRIQKQCKIIDPEQNIVKVGIEYTKFETNQENSAPNFKLR